MTVQQFSLTCPLCGGRNFCGNEVATSKECWCQHPAVEFPAALLARVPADLKGKSCICQDCVNAFHQQAIKPPGL